MSIEALIREQIEVLKANTAAVLLLEASLVGRAGGNSKPTKEELQQAVAELKAEGVDYGTVRELVLKLAPTKREEIKALNAKFGIANLKVLLDKEDDFSTVNDQSKLDAIYADLQKLEA